MSSIVNSSPAMTQSGDDDVIITAIRRIVNATSNPMHAEKVLGFLKRELHKAYGGDDDGDIEKEKEEEEDEGDEEEKDDSDEDDERSNDLEEDMEDGDQVTTTKKGDMKVHSRKKSEADKWRELIVYPLRWRR
jgi:hypothetical protein